jgi:steroid 5-alpha reductase family enzyme
LTGLGIYVFGLAFEVVADLQKTQWSKEKSEKKYSEEFVTSGLWSKSRHPNYFVEITLWARMATSAAAMLASSAEQSGIGWSGSLAATLAVAGLVGLSPLASGLILIKVSRPFSG